MLTEKQLEANRANAQKSTGPKTESGKLRSRLNAARHGLTGQVAVLPEEDMAAYNKFVQEIVESMDVENANERNLAQSYASYQWRINRAAALENTMFTLGVMEDIAENLNIEHPEAHNATSNAKTFRSEAHEFEKLSIYNQRLVNQADKVLKQLRQFQAERKARFQAEIENAVLLHNFHQMQGVAFDPSENGFDLTTAQIKTFLRLEMLLKHSRIARDLDFDPVEWAKQPGLTFAQPLM